VLSRIVTQVVASGCDELADECESSRVASLPSAEYERHCNNDKEQEVSGRLYLTTFRPVNCEKGKVEKRRTSRRGACQRKRNVNQWSDCSCTSRTCTSIVLQVVGCRTKFLNIMMVVWGDVVPKHGNILKGSAPRLDFSQASFVNLIRPIRALSSNQNIVEIDLKWEKPTIYPGPFADPGK